MRSYTGFLVAISIAVFPLQTHATCYSINGTKSDDTHQPCDPDAEVSACCATNKANPDICLSSGLCYAQEPSFNGLIYSNGCTDETGLDERCPHFCPDRTNDWNGGDEVETYNVLQCNAGKRFCCRSASDTDNCCDNNDATGTFNIGTLLFAEHTATATAKPTTSTYAILEPTHSNPPSSSECPKDNTAVVGGAVGGGLGVALLASLGVIIVLWRRRKQDLDARHPMVYDTSETSHDQTGYAGYGHSYNAVQELDARPARSELDMSSHGK